jgi:hypothetical protein
VGRPIRRGTNPALVNYSESYPLSRSQSTCTTHTRKKPQAIIATTYTGSRSALHHPLAEHYPLISRFSRGVASLLTWFMDVYAELSARHQRPAHPTMAAPSVSPKMKFPVASVGAPPVLVATSVDTNVSLLPSAQSSQETLSSPLSAHRVVPTASTGSSPTKTSSSSSSYEMPTTFTQFHPSNKPTAPLYRPAALRSADHPAPPQPFPRRNSFTFKEVPSVKKDHWKVSPTSLGKR